MTLTTFRYKGCLGSLIQTCLSEMTDSPNLKNNHRPHCDKITTGYWKVKENLSHSEYFGLICCSHLFVNQNNSWNANKQTKGKLLVYWQIASGSNRTVKALNSTSPEILVLCKPSCSSKILQEASMRKSLHAFRFDISDKTACWNDCSPQWRSHASLSKQY